MYALRSTPNHIPLKYRCPSNMSNQIGPTHLTLTYLCFYLMDGGGTCVRKPLMVEVGSVDVPDFVTYLNRTPIFEWYVVRCGSNKRYVLERDWTTCLNMLTISNSIVNTIWRTYTLNSIISTTLMSLLLLYHETLWNGCSWFRSHSLLSYFLPCITRLTLK